MISLLSSVENGTYIITITNMYKTLQDLPMEMRETNKPTLYPQSMIVDLIIKLDNRDYYIAHADQSLSIVDNIKNMLTILSDNRITFTR